MCALGGHAARLGGLRGVPACTAHLHAIDSSLQALRRGCGLSTWLRTGRRVRSLEAFALPAYKIARKSEDEMAGAVGELSSPSGPRFPFKVRPRHPATPERPAGPWPALPHRHLPSHWLLRTRALCCAQDEFEISKGLVLSGQQVVDTLAPLMTPERMQRIDEVGAGWRRE